MRPVLSFVPLLAACAQVPSPAGVEGELASNLSTGSTTLVDAGDGDGVYLLDEDARAVLRYDLAADTFVSEPLDALPGRITRAGDRVWVTLPADRGIAVFRATAEGLVREDTWETGAEPLGIVARADGARIYVALATEGEVRELDADGNVLRRWEVGGQPSWLALRPAGDDLYVGSALGGRVTWIDLDLGSALPIALPEVTSDGRAAERHVLSQRVTGDPAVSPDGGLLAVPMLLADNQNPAPDEETEQSTYSSSGDELSTFNPVVALITLQENGVPVGEDASMVLTVGRRNLEGFVRSYLTSATFAPDGAYVIATMEASSTAVLVPINSYQDGIDEGTILSLATKAGPRGAAFVGGNKIFVDNALHRSVSWLPTEVLDRSVGVMGELRMESPASYGPSPLDPEVVAGRALFYSATNGRMTQDGAGVSCSTCHQGGRADGLVWSLEGGERQTPSLAGGISATAPFTWADRVDSVAEEAELTSSGRMGGQYLGSGAEQLAAYIESIRAPDVPALGSADPAVLRGQAIFQRADVGCTGCHYGALHTDNAEWPLFGMDAVNTPSLRRVSTTAPYLHDGRAETLREVLELSVYGAMGDTSMLSEAELDDLEAYLRSL